jgi:hypothetical protein
LADIIAGIRVFISKGDYIDVMDYSGTVAPTVKEGYIVFTDVAVDPQAFDGASGIRMLNINAGAVRTLL